jgi:hypothetical protein
MLTTYDSPVTPNFGGKYQEAINGANKMVINQTRDIHRSA